MSLKVYLAGYISGSKLEQCQEWRNRLKQSFPSVHFIDPMKGESDESIRKNEFKSNLPARDIFTKDYHSVKDCDILIANLDTFGASRPLTGTVFEMAWAYDWRKIILTMTTDPNYRRHPFVREASTRLVSSQRGLEKALDFYVDYLKWK